MKRAALIFIGVILLSCLSPSWSVPAQQPQESTATLYAVNKHQGEQLKYCINFKRAVTGSLRAPCDVAYGMLYAGDDLDWFESSLDAANRSVIKDLGEHSWTGNLEVPVVEPLPKLKPGEQRHIGVDTSGADGAPGAPGKPGADFDGVVRAQPIPVTAPASPVAATPARPKNDGKPKIDPVFVKAVVGHVYVIHVVDETRDFYALFRVETLERGDFCTVSWKLIPDPLKPADQTALR